MKKYLLKHSVINDEISLTENVLTLENNYYIVESFLMLRSDHSVISTMRKAFSSYEEAKQYTLET